MLRFLLFLLLVLGTTPPLSAQVNTEAMRAQVERGVNGSLGTAFTLRQGNTELYIIGLNGRLDVFKGKHKGFVIGKVQFLQSTKDVLVNNGFGHIRYNGFLKTWLIYEVFGQIEYDETRLLNRRLLAGTGVRFKLFKDEKSSIYLGTTPMLENEELNPKKVTTENPSSTVVRWSNYFVGQTETKNNVTLGTTFYIQPRVDDWSDLRILSDLSMNVLLNDHISFGVTMTYRYDSEPPVSLKSYDLLLQNSLTVSF